MMDNCLGGCFMILIPACPCLPRPLTCRVPFPGASLCATDDGRRLYLFGGHDGSQLLGDVHYLEVGG
jgi:hypothetical protein